MATLTDTLIRSLSALPDPLSIPLAEARAVIGRTHVLSPPTANQKLVKGSARGWQTASLSLAPASSAGLPTACPRSTPECRRYCVAGSGNAIALRNVTDARISLTRRLAHDPAHFLRVLVDDLERLHALARRDGQRLAVRLNTFSDLAWERIYPSLFEVTSTLRIPVYDYTKILDRAVPYGYRLTLSHSEVNRIGSDPDLLTDLVEAGINVAVPFAVNRGSDLPRTWHGVRVVDGDRHDLRFLDPIGVVVGLRSKVTRQGKAGAGGGFVLPVLGQEVTV